MSLQFGALACGVASSVVFGVAFGAATLVAYICLLKDLRGDGRSLGCIYAVSAHEGERLAVGTASGIM